MGLNNRYRRSEVWLSEMLSCRTIVYLQSLQNLMCEVVQTVPHVAVWRDGFEPSNVRVVSVLRGARPRDN